MTILIYRNKESIRSKNKTVLEYIGSLFTSLELSSKIGGIYYEIVMGLRGTMYVYSLYLSLNYPLTFLVIQLAISIGFIAFVTIFKVLERKLFLIINILSEVCLSLVFSELILVHVLDVSGLRNSFELGVTGCCVFFLLFASLAHVIAKCISKFSKEKKTKVVPFIGEESYRPNKELGNSDIFAFVVPKDVLNDNRSNDNDIQVQDLCE